MRQGLIVVGVGALVLIVGGLLVNRGFMQPSNSGRGILESGTASTTMTTFSLSSSAFTQNASIPSQYTCDGLQASPPLSISGTPEGAASLALIMEDPDVPKQLKPDGVFLHWVVFNIPASVTELVEGASVGVQGKNGAGKNGYAGPCPPPQYEPSEHRYIFTLYALDANLSLEAGATKDAVVQAMEEHIVAQTQLIGKYKRK